MSQLSTSKAPNQKKKKTWLYSLWKFARPHTIIGTSLSILALYLIALATFQISLTVENIGTLLGALGACWCGNIYIVGLNQLEDFEIDKINKPDLPLAAGDFSLAQGKVIIATTGILALVISGLLGIYLWGTVAISLAIGTAYSLPPIRLKRFPFWAAFCIFTVRGVIVNLGIFLHFSQKFTSQEFLPSTVWALTLFIVIFTIAIAIFKDVPDMEGDRQYNITTFTILLGKQAIFNLSRWLITVCYLVMIALGIFWLSDLNLAFLIISHLGLLVLLWWRSQKVDLDSKIEIASFYQFIWKLFFWEYLLFPVACLIG
jgi:homogentisate phytyltransferase/homogentisate geranylgeranyltransferase